MGKIIKKLLKNVVSISVLVLILLVPFKSYAEDYDCKFELLYIESDNENVDFYIDIKLKAEKDFTLKNININFDIIYYDEMVQDMLGNVYLQVVEDESNCSIGEAQYNDTLLANIFSVVVSSMDETYTEGNIINIAKVAFKIEKHDDYVSLPDFDGDFTFYFKNSNSYLYNGERNLSCDCEDLTLNIQKINDGSYNDSTSGGGSGGSSSEGSSSSESSSSGGQGSDSEDYNEKKVTLNMLLNSNSSQNEVMIDFEIEIPVDYVFSQLDLEPLFYFNDSDDFEILYNYKDSEFIKSFQFNSNNELGTLIGMDEDSGYISFSDTKNFDFTGTLFLGTLVITLKDDIVVSKLRISFDQDDLSNIEDIDGNEDVFNFTDLIITFGDTTTTVYNVTYMLDQTTQYTSRQVIKGNKVIKPADPTKEGYTFKGWYESLNDQTAFDFNTIISSNLTLYAKWEEISSSGGGSGGTGSDSEEGESSDSGIISDGGQGELSDDYLSDKVTLNTSLNANSTEKNIMIDFEIEIPNKYAFSQLDLEPLLYFNESNDFEILYEYKTSTYVKSYQFNSNNELGTLIGMDEDSGYISFSDTKNFDFTGTLFLGTLVITLKDDTIVSKLRISFDQDDLSNIEDIDGNEDVFNFTDLIITFGDTTTTVYNVTYMLDQTTQYTSRQVIKGNKVIKPADPTKEGYNFLGWYESLSDRSSFDFDTITINSNLTLYAKFESQSIPKFKITFITNGGSSVEEITTSYLELEPQTTKEGYTFIGWFQTQVLTLQVSFPYTPTRNIILYAKWEENGILNTDEELPSDTPYLIVKDSICNNDGYFTLKYYLYNPTNIVLNTISVDVINDGYCSIDSFESGSLINFILNDTQISANNISISNNLIYIGTLTFKVNSTTEYKQRMTIESSFRISSTSTSIDMTKLNTVLTEITSNFLFSVTFMIGDTEYTKQYLQILEEDKIPKPEKEGYTFIGWYKEKNCYEANKCTYPMTITKNIVLYAKFESDSICSLKYEVKDSTSKIIRIDLYLINPKGLQINLVDLTFTSNLGNVIGYDYSSCNLFDIYEYEQSGILAYFILKSNYTKNIEIYLGTLLILNNQALTNGTIICDENYSLFNPNEDKLELKCEEFSFECSNTYDNDLSSDTSLSNITVTVDNTLYQPKGYVNNQYTFGKFDSSFDEAQINIETKSISSYIRISKYNNASSLASISSDIKGSISHTVNMYDSSQTYIIVITAEDGTQKEYKVTLLKLTDSESTANIIYEIGNSDNINSYYQSDIIVNVYLYNANYKVGKLDIIFAYDTDLFDYSSLTISCNSYQLSSNILEYTNYLTFTLYSQEGVNDSSKYLVCQIHLKFKEDIEHKEYNVSFDGRYLDDVSSIYNPAGTEKSSTTTGTLLSISEGTSPYLTEFKLYDDKDNIIFEAKSQDLLINDNTIEIYLANGYSALYYYLNANTKTTVKLDSSIKNKEQKHYILLEDELELVFNMTVYNESQTASITIKIIKEEESEAKLSFQLKNTDTIDIYYKNEIIIDIYIDNANYYISKLAFNLIYDTNILTPISESDYYEFESIYTLESITKSNGIISVILTNSTGYFNLDKYLVGSIKFKLKDNLTKENHDVEITSDTIEFYNNSSVVQDYDFESLTFTVFSGDSPYLTQFYIEDSNGNVIYSASSTQLNINNNEIKINLDYKYDSIKYFVDASSTTSIYLDNEDVSKLTAYTLNLEVEDSITLEFSTYVDSNQAEAYITFIITRQKEEIKVSKILELVDGCSFKYVTIVFEDDGFGIEMYFEDVTHEQYQEGKDMDILSLVMPYLTIEELLSQFKQYSYYKQGLCYFKVIDIDGYEYEEDEYSDSFTKICTGFIIEYYSLNDELLDKIAISIPGDVNCDGYVNTSDIQSIFGFLTSQNYDDYTYAQLISMNIKYDDVIERIDANTIINYLKETSDPFEDITIVEYQEEEELSINMSNIDDFKDDNLQSEQIIIMIVEDDENDSISSNNISFNLNENNYNFVLYLELDFKEWLYEI